MNIAVFFKKEWKVASLASFGTAALICCAFISPKNHFISALFLIITSIVLYCSFVFQDKDRNYLSFRAVFSFVWLFTIGLADLKLADYQKTWKFNTWLYLALAFAVYHIGLTFGSKLGEKISSCILKKHSIKKRFFIFAFRPERLFPICITVTLIGLACFIANARIKGWIPFFSNQPGMYAKFYTKFYLFAVAASMISGLCYYCFKTQALSKGKKIALILCIIYSTFIFPILIVSRGTFISSALTLTAVIYYLNKKKFTVLVLCIVTMFGTYEFVSKLRNYSNEALNKIFMPSRIVLYSGDDDVGLSDNSDISFQMSGKAAFLYSYLTVGHDNFNEAVESAATYSYGLREFAPFNVILRIPTAKAQIKGLEHYHLIKDYFTTINIIGDAYYDFRWFGIALFMLIWSVGFGTVESCYLKGKGVFSLLALGVTLTPVALCFFDAWMSNFTVWMHWGGILLICLATCTTILTKKHTVPSENGST